MTSNPTQKRETQLEQLLEFLCIPSVSTDSAYKSDVRRAAEWLVTELEQQGFKAQLFDTPKHPVVFAEYRVDDALPTVLVYGHYDVQPPDPEDLWDSPPFDPVVTENEVIARGASDDKGQVYAHVKGAEAVIAETGTLPVNLKFIIEGEEEIGSPNLTPFIEEHRALLAADIVLISDGAMIAPETPTVTYGLKGLAYVEVRVKGADLDLHSGAYGGGVPNPINGLAKMIALLHDENGRVTVPGFYDAVLELTAEEREAFERVPFDESEFARGIGVSATPGEEAYGLLERLWARPTLDANGIGGGFQGEGAKTVIPSEASAKISCRLVPNQDPADITQKLSTFLKENAPMGLKVSVTDLHGGMPALTPLDSPAVQAAAEALEKVFSKETIFARTGGTIPVVSTFQKLLEADVVLVGFGNQDDRIHSPNEKFDLASYYKGIEASAALLSAFAELSPKDLG